MSADHIPTVFDTIERARDGSRVPVTMSRPSANTETVIPGSTSARTSHGFSFTFPKQLSCFAILCRFGVRYVG